MFNENIMCAELVKVSTRVTLAAANATVTAGGDEVTVVQPKPPPTKKVCGLFAHYKPQAPRTRDIGVNPEQQLSNYMGKINEPDFSVDEYTLKELYHMEQYSYLKPLFHRFFFCIPVISVPECSHRVD